MDKKAFLIRLHEEKYRAFGAVLSRIVHDIRNHLSGIIGFSRLIAENTGEEQTRQDAEKVLADGEACLAYVEDLGTVFRKPELRIESIDPAPLLEESAGQLREQFGLKPDQIAVTCPAQPCLVEADGARLRDILKILLLSRLEAAVRSDRPPRAEIFLRREDRCAVIEVRDNGPAIDYAHLLEIFDPFTTALPERETRRRDLSRPYNILHHMQGRLGVYNIEGGGAAARIELPLTPA
jgi:two-component system C4-dicarboxylate transport sensor histidine kinase DctB